ncbi:MAG: hypothetical protein KDH92_09975 [Chloroflexi bacterium]|nr:hypothetical protein [Chloroflexota bacterium]
MTQRQRYHPTDFGARQWARLLDFALARADRFECAIPYPFVAQELWTAPLFTAGLEPLREALIDRHVSLLRGGQTRDQATQYLSFELRPAVAEFIRSVRRLEGWSWSRRMPEDPSFLIDETLLLATDSVGGRITVYADPDERQALQGAGIRLIEPLGVQAEPWPTP